VDPLLIEKKPGYAIVTLNDPDRRNVFTLEMSSRVSAAFTELEADETVSAVVITGAGTAFCSGGHLDELLANPGHAGLRKIYAGFVRIAESSLATIAAVNGAAVGAGMNAALACDVIIAAESAKFDSRFLQIGIGPGGGHTWRLRNLTDLQTVKAMVLFGEALNGPRAVDVGLAWKCVPQTELLPAAEALAIKAAKAPRELLLRTKQTIHRTQNITSGTAAIDNELDTQAWSMDQPAFKEMVKAVKQKIAARNPKTD
jgi:enoyl-CoA hydratase